MLAGPHAQGQKDKVFVDVAVANLAGGGKDIQQRPQQVACYAWIVFSQKAGVLVVQIDDGSRKRRFEIVLSI
jgi:hypothetical protein